jgi:hypothetical protein
VNPLDRKSRQRGDLADVHKTKERRNGKIAEGRRPQSSAVGFWQATEMS